MICYFCRHYKELAVLCKLPTIWSDCMHGNDSWGTAALLACDVFSAVPVLVHRC